MVAGLRMGGPGAVGAPPGPGTHLTGIGDVWISVDSCDFAAARRLGRAFAEDLRLREDLGWAETIDREAVALTVPPDDEEASR
jgi:hypothetical protein